MKFYNRQNELKTSLEMEEWKPVWNRAPMAKLFRKARTAAGEIVLCDFMSAGMAGTRYQSFLPVAEELAKDIFQYFCVK